jgi:menaquinone-9 beta-reductase
MKFGRDIRRTPRRREHTGRVWDVVVVGAGPAGATAALGAMAASPGVSVLLLDRAEFPRDKPCGDGIAPQALDVLAGLGVRPVGDRQSVQRLRLGFPEGPAVSGRMRRPAYVVPRAVFDARLVEAAVDRGAQLRRQVVRSVVRRADHVLVDGIAARVVIGADGANGVVRRLIGLGDPRPGSIALAIRGYAPLSASTDNEQVITFAGGRWPAYAWSFPLGDGRANVGYGEVLVPGRSLRRGDLLARLDDLLPGAAADATGWRAHHLPLSSGRPRQPDGRVLLAGDALSLINPLTGEGIYYAVLSGALAGRAAVTGGDAGRRYRTALGGELGRHLRHTSVAARLARHRAVVNAGVIAAHRPEIFDDLVEIGLGRGLLTPRLLTSLASAVVRRTAA